MEIRKGVYRNIEDPQHVLRVTNNRWTVIQSDLVRVGNSGFLDERMERIINTEYVPYDFQHYVNKLQDEEIHS